MKKIRWDIIEQVAVFIIAAIVMFAVISGNNQAIPAMTLKVSFQGDYKTENGDWKPIVKGEHIPAFDGDITLRGYFQSELPDGEVIARLNQGSPIALYFNHIGAEIFIDGQESHIFDSENAMIGENACGKQWIVYEYTGTDNDIVEIVLKNPHKFGNYNAVNEFLDSMYMYSGVGFKDDMLKKGNTERTIGLIVIIISFIVIGIAVFSSLLGLQYGHIICLISMMMLFAGGYFTFNSSNIGLWNEWTAFNTGILQICMMLYVFCLMSLIVKCLSEKTKKAGRIIAGISGLSTGILFIISLADDIFLYDVNIYWAIIHTIVGAVMLSCCIYDLKNSDKNHIFPLILCILSLIALLTDILGTAFGWWQGGFISKCIFILIFAAALIIVLKIIPENYRDARETRRMADELRENRISIMLSQIQPHFLYNTLNTIYYLCGKNKEAAQKAICDFSDYLRCNMDSLKRTAPVTFNEELKHLKIYLSLEKLRFEDKLNIVYDIQAEDFMIPALTIQPIVENAVRHGICKSEHCGTIEITSKEYEKYYEVKVSDNGAGFDINEVKNDGRSHIGIENVRNRLWKMSSAVLEISSEKGKGTTAVIRIPKENAV